LHLSAILKAGKMPTLPELFEISNALSFALLPLLPAES
jgi:hypothetical protein